MRIILDIATILGGIVALWFLWDKFNAFRISQRKQTGNEPAQFASLDSPFWQIFLMFIMTAASCGIAGSIAGFAVVKLGFWGALAAIATSIAVLFIGSALEAKEMNKYEALGFPLLLGSGCMLWWAVIAMIVSLTISLYTGVTFKLSKAAEIIIFAGGIIGVIFGFAVSYGVYSQAKNSTYHY